MTALDRLAAALADRYRIEREIGAGGMATVYLADDVRHRRKVAVKVLRPELAATMGPDRFLREIEIAAQLQHPHILPLLDSGAVDAYGPADGHGPATSTPSNFLYYVMPYVQGESLRERLSREHELPIHDAVRILTEVADALSHAHDFGVVHRDIKPENIMLSGRHALITDFGVAKAVSEASGPLRLTSVGVALGTPTYMAPEQAAADPQLDHRVDIDALGVVAYEMLAGQPPFTGRTAQDVLAAHMTRAPVPIRQYRASIAPLLEAVVLRCLEKHPADRWQSTAQLLSQLEPLASPSGAVTPTSTEPVRALGAASRRREPPRWLAWAAGGALVAAGAFALSLRQESHQPLVVGRRIAVAVSPGWERWPSFAADGKTIVYSRGSIGNARLVVQQIGGGAPIPVDTRLTGWQCCGSVSPDGSRLLFLTAQGLFVAPTLGGQARAIRENRETDETQAVPRVLWGSWSPSGREVVYTELDSVFVHALESGERRAVAHAKDAHSPVWSPDGRFIAFVRGNPLFHRNGNLAPAAIAIVASDGGSVELISDTSSFNTNPVWLDRSRILYISDRDGGRDLYVQYLSRAGRPSGDPLRITTGLGPDRIAVSADGSTVAWSTLAETTGIWSLPIAEGDSLSLSRATPVITGSETIEVATASRDGAWLYYDSDLRGSADIWRVPLAEDGAPAGEPQQITNDPVAEFSPSPSPDGTRVAFHSFRAGNRDLFIAPTSGGGGAIQITDSPEHDWNPRWSPDGRRIVFDRQLAPDSTLWLIEQLANGKWAAPRALPIGTGALLPRWSPDGTRISFGFRSAINVLEVATGRNWVAGAPTRTAAWTEWSEDGRTIYVAGITRDGSARIWAMPAEGGTARTVAYAEEGDLRTHRHGLTIARRRFYLPLIERKADVWVAELRTP